MFYEKHVVNIVIIPWVMWYMYFKINSECDINRAS